MSSNKILPVEVSYVRSGNFADCTAKEINEKLGVKSNGGGMWSIYTGKNVCKQLPTEELWNKLQQILQFDLPYSKICQTYNAQLGITDVWDDISFYSEDRYKSY